MALVEAHAGIKAVVGVGTHGVEEKENES